jgi:hypothetical protein
VRRFFERPPRPSLGALARKIARADNAGAEIRDDHSDNGSAGNDANGDGDNRSDNTAWGRNPENDNGHEKADDAASAPEAHSDNDD